MPASTLSAIAATTQHRVIVIDDNSAIHNDFSKILTDKTEPAFDLSDLENQLFGLVPNDETIEVQQDNGTSLLFELDYALQGKQGFKMVRQAVDQGNPYAMAFVDMRMPPGWNGLETIENLWRADPDLQVVICSAYSDHSWSEISKRLGINDQLLILKKPFDPIEIVQATHSLCCKRSLLNASRDQISILDEQMQQQTTALEATKAILAGKQQQLQKVYNNLEDLQQLFPATDNNQADALFKQALGLMTAVMESTAHMTSSTGDTTLR